MAPAVHIAALSVSQIAMLIYSFFPGFPPPPNPYRSNHQHTHTHTHTHNDLTPMPEDQLLQALMEMIASENDMAPQMLFGGMPGFGATRGGASSFGDYATTEREPYPSIRTLPFSESVELTVYRRIQRDS
jgi:hypothetical protein